MIYNRCYLVNSDTGAYVGNQFRTGFIKDRSKFYSVFLLFTNFKLSLLFSVWAQSFIVNYGFYLYFKYLLGLKRNFQKVGITNFILVLTSSLGWYVSNISPDIFTAIYILFVALYIFSNLPKLHRRMVLAIIFISIAVHNSNFLLNIGIIGILIISQLFTKRSLKKVILYLSNYAVLIGLTLSVAHYINFNKFSMNPSSPIFLMSRLAEMGILKQYLDEHCDQQPQLLCEQKEQIHGRQWNFMWDDGLFPHTQMGWMNDTMLQEYKATINDIFKTQKYRNAFIKIGFQDFLLQCSFTNVNDGIDPMGKESSAYISIAGNYLFDAPFLLNAKQQNASIPFGIINRWLAGFMVFYLIALVVGMIAIRKRKSFQILLYVSLLLLVALAFNNLATSMLSTYLGRFQSRVLWLIPFFSIALFWYWWNERKEFTK